MPAPGTIRPFSLEGTPAKDLTQNRLISIAVMPLKKKKNHILVPTFRVYLHLHLQQKKSCEMSAKDKSREETTLCLFINF